MRILLDECLPRRLKGELAGHEVATVPEMGWASIKNGRLLRLAETAFDVFITVDRNLEHQEDLTSYQIATIVLGATSNRFESLRPLMPTVSEALTALEVGDVIHVRT